MLAINYSFFVFSLSLESVFNNGLWRRCAIGRIKGLNLKNEFRQNILARVRILNLRIMDLSNSNISITLRNYNLKYNHFDNYTCTVECLWISKSIHQLLQGFAGCLPMLQMELADPSEDYITIHLNKQIHVPITFQLARVARCLPGRALNHTRSFAFQVPHYA